MKYAEYYLIVKVKNKLMKGFFNCFELEITFTICTMNLSTIAKQGMVSTLSIICPVRKQPGLRFIIQSMKNLCLMLLHRIQNCVFGTNAIQIPKC